MRSICRKQLFHSLRACQRSFFKNTENQQPNDENQIFKAKTKEKWTPAENHHSIETFINLVEKDIHDAKNEPKKRPKQNLTKRKLEAQKQGKI